MIFAGIELCCPACRGDLREVPSGDLICRDCERRFPVTLGIPDLRVAPDPYIEPEADRAKGERLAARASDLSFVQLVEHYYSITPAVPPPHARQYTRGLLAGEARARAALETWECARSGRSGGRLLEIGCGTGPLLAAAGPRFTTLVGIDVAFRWLVVGQKRLAEAGVEAVLVCACAEALPFPAGAFDIVVADSVLEHVADQRATLAECHRVLAPGGRLYLSTPNRWSLGPDPHLGLWAAGLLPQRWLAAYVRWQGGIPPQRRLLSARSVRHLISAAGFVRPRVMLPDVSRAQRDGFGRVARLAIDGYQVAKRLPLCRLLLHWIGPVIHAVSEKPGVSAATLTRTRE